MRNGHRSYLAAGAVILGGFLAARFLLPTLMPFLFGTALALLAEPMTAFFCRKLRLPRGAGAGISVSMAFCFLVLLLFLLGALLVREVGVLTRILPDLEQTAKSGMALLSQWLQELTRFAPAGLGRYLSASISDFFSSGTALLDKAAGWLLNFASGLLSHVPDSALGLGTALISSYMISAKLPLIRRNLRAWAARKGICDVFATLGQLRQVLGGWLRAQAKLCGITWIIVTLGFVLLRIPYAPLWAILVALVDAFPILGTGTVLLPWALVRLLRGDFPQALGLVGTYAAAMLSRSILEPRLVGRQLGLDPLVTLFALYAGYKLWGFGGMLLTPMLAAAAVQLLPGKERA